MAKDHNGEELQVGDLVYLPCRILAVSPKGRGEVDMQTEYPLPGASQTKIKFTADAGQVIRVTVGLPPKSDSPVTEG
jgi:hypothetical protein